MSECREVLLRKHSRREFRDRMSSDELKACIVPIAAIEQHLEHLAMEHDWRSVTHVATAVAERLRPHVIVAEGLMAGVSEHHMKHPGTLTLSVGSFLSSLADIIDSMVRAGFSARRGVDLWRRMAARAGGASGPAILSTHPSDAARVQQLDAYIAARGYS